MAARRSHDALTVAPSSLLRLYRYESQGRVLRPICSWQPRAMAHDHALRAHSTVGHDPSINSFTTVDAAPAGQVTPVQQDFLRSIRHYRHHESVTTGTGPISFFSGGHRFDSVLGAIHLMTLEISGHASMMRGHRNQPLRLSTTGRAPRTR